MSQSAVFGRQHCLVHGLAQLPRLPPAALLRTRQLNGALLTQKGPSPSSSQRVCKLCVAASAQVETAQPSLSQIEAVEVTDTANFPAAAGVYGIYDASNDLQYIGISRKVAVSIATHKADLPDKVHAAKVAVVQDASKDNLTAAWKQWIQEAVDTTGSIPPGNAPGASGWTRRRAPKPEIKLTPGKGVQDLTCGISDLIDQVVKTNKVVAFVKGTRTQPQCGFSFKVLTLLQENRADFEVVNVLDDVYNPGLREELKQYSDWPTIPQLYINGEFVGGADIVEELHNKGELKQLLQQ